MSVPTIDRHHQRAVAATLLHFFIIFRTFHNDISQIFHLETGEGLVIPRFVWSVQAHSTRLGAGLDQSSVWLFASLDRCNYF